ncbi:MAG: ornithine carbamoyltransferase [Candidatus Omnitrophica bacterium]|nr:ornithine carbamoyltransferase [Candidatus Omnitrophota bacterium]
MVKGKDFISILDLGKKDIEDIFTLSGEFKHGKKKNFFPLSGKFFALIFEKPSTRTRVSFEVAIGGLGGGSIYLGPGDIQFGRREPVKDIARVMERYVHGIVARTFSHKHLLELAGAASVPVINGLTDLFHPCQVMGDLFTILEKKKNLKGLKIAFIGDGNNVANSWIAASTKLPFHLSIAAPEGYEPKAELVKKAKVKVTNSPEEAAKDADVLYTDVWVSMGQEEERKERLKRFKYFQIDKHILKLAKKDVLVMHCLPAHRGEEISDGVIEGKHSVVFDQAENRLHVQKAILTKIGTVPDFLRVRR